MKAFQLKIVIKNSKPPIWRRVIVPAGITFSQLSMILNEVMGWSGYHLFQFEFYHLGLYIEEESEDFAFGYAFYQCMEASTTLIGEYLEGNDWFTYTYDLGDDWQHRVTVEKVLEDYEYDYPQVIKYKGDCPVEDCGGIYGYYDCLDIISDKGHPEYEERLEWMESQGYPREYDPDDVNRVLREEFFYRWGKGEIRCQRDIYMEHFGGKPGLNAVKEEQAISLKDILADYDKESIMEMAKEKGLKHIAGCRKDVLIEKLTAHMLQPEVMRSYFLCLQDDELEEFEMAAAAKGLYVSEEPGRLMLLNEIGYVGMLEDGRAYVPEEIRTVYQSFRDRRFEEDREKTSYLLCCLRVSGILYGITPMPVLQKLLARNSMMHMAGDEVRIVIEGFPSEVREFVLVGNTVYRMDLYPDDRGLRDAQGDMEFYIPTLEEIRELGIMGCLGDCREAKRVKRFLMKHMDADQDEAAFACRMIQREITGDCTMQEVFQILEAMELEVEDDRKLDELISLLNDLWNNTRMLLNRGFTPKELKTLAAGKPLPVPAESNIIEFRPGGRTNKE